jgi:hypothetical protein
MPTFILGAGFNSDATEAARPVYGNSLYIGRYRIDCGYPLVKETLKLCFGLEDPPPGQSIEELFDEALAKSDYEPVRKLSEKLFEADSYIAQRLASENGANCYRTYFEFFEDSHFLTLNYDSLVETFLYRLGRWYPHDGYGVPVQVVYARGTPNQDDKTSPQRVLHLHGSLCIRTIDYELHPQSTPGMCELTLRSEPLFLVDPSSIAGNFRGYGRKPGFDPPQDQIIAPIPDKAEGLKGEFVKATYETALTRQPSLS